MKEYQLCEIVKNWLIQNGWEVYCEVAGSNSYRFTDMVATHDNKVIAIETKLSLTKNVIHQAYNNHLHCNSTLVAIATKPKQIGIEECKKFGIGIITINPKPQLILKPRHQWKIYLPFMIMESNKNIIGGKPNEKGNGVTYDVLDRIKEYVKSHPDATWREIYQNIDHHYSSQSSLSGAMLHWRRFRLRDYKAQIKNSC